MATSMKQWIYAQPLGDSPLGPEHFALRELPMPDVGAGQALVRVKLINIHSRTRTRMASGSTRIGKTDPSNYACAKVIRSRDPAFKEGDVIACQAGWQDYALVSSADPCIGYGPITDGARALNHTNSQWTYVFRPELVQQWSPDILMDVFGTSGMTAWFGMRECGPIMASDHVLIAGASGSVGSLAAQLARNAGAHVVGLAGGDERCASVKSELGIDVCLNYRAPDFADQLAQAFPEGIDLFSDGIGGHLTRLAVDLLKPSGRLFAYGSSAAFYGNSGQVGSRSLRESFGISPEIESVIQAKGIRVACWIVDAFYNERLAAEDALSELISSGLLRPVNTVVRGFDKLPQAIADLYRKPHQGKLQIDFGH